MGGASDLRVRWLGTVPYADAVALQDSLVAARRRGQIADTLLLLEHPAVVTLGRGSKPENILIDEEELTRRGVECSESGRGGDVTYHAPGQLVGYPILALPRQRRDAHRYLRDVEEALIRTAADFGVVAERACGLTGIWVAAEKLAAIGVRLNSGWITSHGFAINVDLDLDGFALIVPCGIRDRGVTSLARLLADPPGVKEVAAHVAARFAEVFRLRPVASTDPGEGLA